MTSQPDPPANADAGRTDDIDHLRFLVAAGQLLGTSLDYRETLATVCKAAVEAIADVCILDIGSVRDLETAGVAHRDPALTPAVEQAHTRLEHDPGRPAHPIFSVLDTGQSVCVSDIDDAWIETHAANAVHAELMRTMEYRSMVIVPVRSQVWGIAGALTLVRTGAQAQPFGRDVVVLAEELGRRCGIAIGKARLHSQALEVARRFQQAALPNELPRVPGFAFDALYEPADAAMLVGGDWYDVFLLTDGNIGISIGDVSGHGLESAALMSSIRNAIRMAMMMERNLSMVLRHADFLFRNEAPEMLCTTTVAVIDRTLRRMTCASAGHPGPLVASHGVTVRPLPFSGVPLGSGDLVRDRAPVGKIVLAGGDLVAFYTDGLVEWNRAPASGEAQVLAALGSSAVYAAEHPARALRDRVVTGAHGDDIAVLTVRIV